MPPFCLCACLPRLQIPAYALYMLAVNVLIPYWNTPKLRDMPETGAGGRGAASRQGSGSCPWHARRLTWAGLQAQFPGGRSLLPCPGGSQPGCVCVLPACVSQKRTASVERRGSGSRRGPPSLGAAKAKL